MKPIPKKHQRKREAAKSLREMLELLAPYLPTPKVMPSPNRSDWELTPNDVAGPSPQDHCEAIG
jgi:hypothetical protein